ncbi:MAG: bacteriocin [Pseudomonadota bacterium]
MTSQTEPDQLTDEELENVEGGSTVALLLPAVQSARESSTHPVKKRLRGIGSGGDVMK